MTILFFLLFVKKQLSYFPRCLLSILFTGACSKGSNFLYWNLCSSHFVFICIFLMSLSCGVHGHSLLYCSWQVVTYLAGCGLQSCPMLLAKGYPDVGWNPIEGERYVAFLRFAVFVNSESHVLHAPQTQDRIITYTQQEHTFIAFCHSM